MSEKLNYKQTILLSFGFFATSIAWSLYNSYVPQLLDKYLSSAMLIGLIMTIDNIFGVIFQPLFGRVSDLTHTRIGRRMPYVLVGIPICAVAFTFIPLTSTLWALMAVVLVFNFVMSAWRAPVVTLMPDLTPPSLRTQANGIVNLLGGVGSLFAFLGGGILFKIGGFPLPFLASAILMVLALIVLLLFVREPAIEKPPKRVVRIQWLGLHGATLAVILAATLIFAFSTPLRQLVATWVTSVVGVSTADGHNLTVVLGVAILICAVVAWFLTIFFGEPKEKKEKVTLSKGERRSLLFILTAIFFWFMGYNAVETFFTLYATKELGMDEGSATMTLAIFSLTFLAAAVPSGFLGAKIGRKKTILIGLVGITILFAPLVFISNVWIVRGCLFLGGLCWACVNINSLPMVTQLADKNKLGTFVGYYYLFSFSANIVSPILFGGLIDLFGSYKQVFLFAAIGFVAAMISLSLVKHGESTPTVSA